MAVKQDYHSDGHRLFPCCIFSHAPAKSPIVLCCVSKVLVRNKDKLSSRDMCVFGDFCTRTYFVLFHRRPSTCGALPRFVVKYCSAPVLRLESHAVKTAVEK